jgi:CRP/FNR family cyclic AMP-dependent transcriptional regulator
MVNMAGKKNVEQLQHVPLFSACTERELAPIVRAMDEVSVGAGKEIVGQGTLGHDFYLIVSGGATVSRDGVTVAQLGPGQYFGELALLDGGLRNATVTITEPTDLLVLGQREFAAVLDSSPGVARKLLTQMAARLREADAQAVTH